MNKGIKTLASSGPEESKLLLPTEIITPANIVAGLVQYYPADMIWIMIGFATACIYMKSIVAYYKSFPPLLCFGISQAGKTMFAFIIASLLGAALKTPSGQSTSKGISRKIHATHCLPIVLNEYGTSLAELIKAVYDRDSQIMARKSADSQIRENYVNTTCILTCENAPRQEGLISRVILVDFNEFKKDQTKGAAFNDFIRKGVLDE